MSWLPFFKIAAFSLFHDSKSADENYFSLKTFFLDRVCEMSWQVSNFITRSLPTFIAELANKTKQKAKVWTWFKYSSIFVLSPTPTLKPFKLWVTYLRFNSFVSGSKHIGRAMGKAFVIPQYVLHNYGH